MAIFGRSKTAKPGRQRKSTQKRSKKSATRRRSAKTNASASGRSIWRAVFKLFAWITLFGIILLAGWLWLLDRRVQAGFNAPFTRIPAHLYARPFTLHPGDEKNIGQIADKLLNFGYRRVKNISQPGEYASTGQIIDIYAYASAFEPTPVAARLVVRDGHIDQLINHASAKSIDSFELSSELIGNLNSGPVEDRLLLQLDEIPEILLDALITMEDKRFASHHGIDPLGILRAMLQNLRDGRVSQGGSTLTQQLVKNLYLDDSRTLKRKINEALMALIIEWRYEKSEILVRYINTIFLGQSGHRAIHGFGLAAQFYFGRDLKDLTTAQISMLVGMIPAPSAYNPFRNSERATKRRNLVLDTLYANGYISAGELDLHKQSALGAVKSRAGTRTRFAAFTDLLKRQLRKSGDHSFQDASGLKVYSTLDSAIQSAAQSNLTTALEQLEAKHEIDAGSLQAAMIILDPRTGEIVSLIGGRKGHAGDFNRALDARRPIGSLVKPAVYLTAFLNPDRYSMASFVNDAPISIELPSGDAWQPGNYDKTYHGSISLHDALIFSYNVPAVKVGMDVGLSAVATTLQRLGIDEELPQYPSMLLGASNLSVLQVAQMYQTIANHGNYKQLTTLRAVADAEDQLLVNHQSTGQQMVNKQADYLLLKLLEEVTTNGTARALTALMPNVQLAGKTGTTNDYRDSWFAGFADNYLAIVWLGKDDNTSTGLTGASGAMRVWANVMSEIDLHNLDLALPEGVAEVEIDLADGQLAVSGCTQSSATRYFVAGYEPISNTNCTEVADKLGGWLEKWFGSGKKETSKKPARDIPVFDALEPGGEH